MHFLRFKGGKDYNNVYAAQIQLHTRKFRIFSEQKEIQNLYISSQANQIFYKSPYHTENY